MDKISTKGFFVKLADISSKHTKRNKIEKMKESRSYMDAWDSLQRYAKEGYDSIAKEDMDYFLKCFGIYDRPATPGRFMMRIRIPAGRLDFRQARMLGSISSEFGRDRMDLTTRMQIQLRYLDISDIPTIMERLESVGLDCWQTGVDNFRNIVSDPLEGYAMDSILPTSKLVKEMQDIWLKKGEWIATLPRKFNTAVSGSMTNRCNLFSHDCCFALAMKNGEYGFNLYLGGKVGAIAESADIFVRSDEVVELYRAIIHLYREFGFRDSRSRNRMRYLVSEAGMSLIRESIEEIAGREYERGGKCLVKSPSTEEDGGKIELSDGRYALRMVVPVGIFAGEAMMRSADIAERYGNGVLNISTTQNLFVMGVSREDIPKVLSMAPFDRYENGSTPYLDRLVACAGSQQCPFGVIENRTDALSMAEYLQKETPLPEGSSVKMHWSGCLKGCGVHGLGDIGFVGCKTRKPDGEMGTGVHISIGGKSTAIQKEAYTILRSVPLSEAGRYVSELTSAYASLSGGESSFEEFESEVLSRYSRGAIEFVIRWNVEVASMKGYGELSFTKGWDVCSEENEIFTFGEEIYRMLTGTKPYQGVWRYEPIETTPPRPPHRISPSVDPHMSEMVMKMIAVREKRYRVFTELLKDMEGFSQS